MTLWQRFRDTLSGRQATVKRKIPILGVEGSGKSSLILTLGQYISLHRLGHVSIGSSPVFGDYVAHIAAGQPLPATMRHERIGLHLDRIPEREGFSDVDVDLTSEDIPGQDFRLLVTELHKNPELSPQGNRVSRSLARFSTLLSDCDGFIFVVDLLRGRTVEEFAQNVRLNAWQGFSEQIEPIMTGILIASRMNEKLKGKPVFFVFSKRDLHQLPPAVVEDEFERSMAIPLAQLRGALLNVRLYHVQCAGWQLDSALEQLGVGELLSDLVHAVGAAPRSRRGE